MVEAFLDLTRAFEKIETSKFPEAEKLRLLVSEAEQMYERLQFTIEDKVTAWRYQDGEVVQAQMTIYKCAMETVDLAEKYFKTKQAYENYDTLVTFYKSAYEVMKQNHAPFYDALLKAMNRAVTKIDYQEGVEKFEELNTQLKRELEMLGQEKAETLEELKRVTQSLQEETEYSTSATDKAKYASDWFEVLSNRMILTTDTKLRIMAFILSRNTVTRDEIFIEAKISRNMVDKHVKDLIDIGMIKVRKTSTPAGVRGTGKQILSANSDYLKSYAQAPAPAETDGENAKRIVESYRIETNELKEDKIQKFLDTFKDPQVKQVAEDILRTNPLRRNMLMKMNAGELVVFAQKIQADAERVLAAAPQEPDEEEPEEKKPEEKKTTAPTPKKPAKKKTNKKPSVTIARDLIEGSDEGNTNRSENSGRKQK